MQNELPLIKTGRDYIHESLFSVSCYSSPLLSLDNQIISHTQTRTNRSRGWELWAPLWWMLVMSGKGWKQKGGCSGIRDGTPCQVERVDAHEMTIFGWGLT